MPNHHTAARLAGLPGMPGTKAAVLNKAKREAWQSRPRKGRGGGREYHIDSLPEVTRAHLLKANIDPLPAPIPEKVHQATLVADVKHDPRADARFKVALWREAIIKPALMYAHGSVQRTLVLVELCQREFHHHSSSKMVKIGKSTLYKWLKDYEANGLAALQGKPRKDMGVKRVLVNKRWDQICPFTEAQKNEIIDKLSRYIRSLWAAGASGWKTIEELSSSKLMTLCNEAGWQVHYVTCRVGRRRVEAERMYRIIHVHDHDAKYEFDHILPRIARNRLGAVGRQMMPGDMVVADVHPLDIPVCRPDGSQVYPRLIAWQDVATNFMWITMIYLEKGEGVRREHVAQSFASFVANSPIGMPRMLYYDNGSEYQWDAMMSGFTELSRLTGRFVAEEVSEEGRDSLRQSAIVTAQPYNSPAKPIEGLFGVLESVYFSQIQGWQAGDRMNKKIQNVGKAPVPFQGNYADLQDEVSVMLRRYHNREQQGSLNGLSPNQAIQKAVDKGFKKTVVQAEALLLAFAETYPKRKLANGWITINGRRYRDDRLNAVTKNLTVKVARHDPRFAFVFEGQKLLCVAKEDQAYGYLQTAGAKESGRRKTQYRREIKRLRGQVDALTLVEEHQKYLEHTEVQPVVPTNQEISLQGEVTSMLKGLEATSRALLDQATDKQNPEKLSQWEAQSNPLLDDLDWDDEEKELCQ